MASLRSFAAAVWLVSSCPYALLETARRLRCARLPKTLAAISAIGDEPKPEDWAAVAAAFTQEATNSLAFAVADGLWLIANSGHLYKEDAHRVCELGWAIKQALKDQGAR